MQIDFQKLARQYGTPLYVYDFDRMRESYRRLKEAFAGHKSLIAYAVKANSNLSVLRLFGKEGAGADCVSIGEVLRARHAGMDGGHRRVRPFCLRTGAARYLYPSTGIRPG